jgi:carotenoid cleavage dioxygenase-like enzyme
MAEPVHFPDVPIYQGWSAPVRLESELRDLEVVQGEVPADLNGTLYRCGPDPQYPPMLGDSVFIDGEGLVSMFRFDHGHVDFRTRYVRNERFTLQEEARRSLFGRYRNRYTNDPSVAGKNMGTANTNAIWHGGKLLILKEDSLPWEVDPDTLETIREWDYDGAVKAVSMTAHPKLDLTTGELLSFSYQAKGDATTDVVFYVVDRHGKIAHELWFNAPWAPMVHDFAVTETHVVIPFFPLSTDLDVIKKGGPFYQWHPERETMVAVFPRRGKTEDVRWFRGPATSAGHMLNATMEGAKLHLDLCLYQGNCFPFFPTPDGKETAPVPPLLTRMSFDLAGNSDGYTTKQLSPMPCEMPRTDDRFQGRAYRHGYMMCFGPDRAQGSMIGHLDMQTGKLDLWNPGPGSGTQEPCFAPRRPDADEGDGYLLVLVNRMNEMRSDLAILDARNISAGPVALIKLPTRVRSTFHGMWVPAKALETGQYPVTALFDAQRRAKAAEVHA